MLILYALVLSVVHWRKICFKQMKLSSVLTLLLCCGSAIFVSEHPSGISVYTIMLLLLLLMLLIMVLLLIMLLLLMTMMMMMTMDLDGSLLEGVFGDGHGELHLLGSGQGLLRELLHVLPGLLIGLRLGSLRLGAGLSLHQQSSSSSSSFVIISIITAGVLRALSSVLTSFSAFLTAFLASFAAFLSALKLGWSP